MESPRTFEDLAILYAYVSAKIEGNSYGLSGAAALLKYGITERRLLSEALMLRNTEAALRWVTAKAKTEEVLSETFLCRLHAVACGQMRPEAVKDAGTLSGLLEQVRKAADPFEQAARIHCALISQPIFGKANDRTARLMQTAVLVEHGMMPLFFEEDEITEYLAAVQAFRERGNGRKYAAFFLKAYKRTIDRLLRRGDEFETDIREDAERIRAYRSRKV